MNTVVSPTIKLVIFDLDGVLMESKELHYEALNRALVQVDPKYIITRHEHETRYDGRPTTAKLNMLTAEKGLPVEMHAEVWRLKQEKTFEVIIDTYKYDDRLRLVLSQLKKKGLTVYCASNSIFKTLQLMLLKTGLLEYFDYILSCEDVLHPKPAPDIYVACMMRENLSPQEVIIVEDSHVGRKAALQSTAHLCPVECPEEVTFEKLMMRIEHINMSQAYPLPAIPLKNINIVMPMASQTDSYETTGFTYSAPLVEGRYTFVTKLDDYEQYNLKYLFNGIAPGCNIITSAVATQGQAHTVLLAKDSINNDNPLLIVNCQQYIEWNADQFHDFCANSAHGGVIATFKNSHPRYSYVKTSEDGFVEQVAEKKTISSDATCGVYYWKRGSNFVKYAEAMIESKPPSECSVIMAYLEAIKDGLKVDTFKCEQSWQLKFPKDLESFYRSSKITEMNTA